MGIEQAPNGNSKEDRYEIISRYPGLRETLESWCTIDYANRPIAPLSLDEVANILIGDREMLLEVRDYLEVSGPESGQDREEAEHYLSELGWNIAKKLVK